MSTFFKSKYVSIFVTNILMSCFIAISEVE